jgi:hypothetical protein
MIEGVPLWILASTEYSCSICDTKPVYFVKRETRKEEQETFIGPMFVTMLVFKFYCEGCYNEYSGVIDGSESNDTESPQPGA